MTRSNSNTEDHRQTVGEWLSRPFVWRIPVYQRHYAWETDDPSGPVQLFWETLKEQAEARLKGENPNRHYLGAIIVDNKTEQGAVDGFVRYDVVDGQQRLTTIQTALLALVRVAKEHDLSHDIGEEMKKYVFVDKEIHNLKNPRLCPSNFDIRQFQKILNDTYDVIWDFDGLNVSKKHAKKSKIVATSDFFEKECSDFIGKHSQYNPGDVINAVINTLLEGVDFVLIVLRKSDNAQRVFESLNNYAEPLTTFDLIRNNVFHRAAMDSEPNLDEKLFYSQDWQQLEDPYWEKNSDNSKSSPSTHIETYIARMLVAKKKKSLLLKRNDIFNAYKECYKEEEVPINDVIPDIVRHTGVYQFLDSGVGQNPLGSELDFGIFHYKNWSNRDFYSVIFSIVDSNVSVEEKRKMIKLLESYVIRRSVCDLTMKNYNKQAPAICGMLGVNPDCAEFSRVLKISKADTTVFPEDKQVLGDCVGANFYKCPFRHYVFEQIELSMHSPRAERVIVQEGQLTIDHILPQGWEGNESWKDIILGAVSNRDEAALTAGNYIHTIGNLTLMSGSSNSAKSNRSLSAVKGLLSESTVKLNRDLAEEEKWNVEKIVVRSKILGAKICEIWPYDIE